MIPRSISFCWATFARISQTISPSCWIDKNRLLARFKHRLNLLSEQQRALNEAIIRLNTTSRKLWIVLVIRNDLPPLPVRIWLVFEVSQGFNITLPPAQVDEVLRIFPAKILDLSELNLAGCTRLQTHPCR